MARNVMKLLKPSPHRARNDFDLSHRHVFDANFGELLPATCIETVPGDNITLHASDLLRAIPFVSSPFLRAKQHLDVWFVPYHDLWHQFDAFITKKREPVSSAFKGANYCPWVSQYSLYSHIHAYGSSTDIVGRPLEDRSYYLLQLLGYGDIENSHGSADSGSTVNSYRMNPFRLAAYNYIWYNEYRQQYYDDGTRLLNSAYNNPANLFNFDRLSCDTVTNADIAYAHGSITAAMCQMRYRCWKKDLFTGVLPSTQFGLVSSLNGGTVSGLTAAFTGSPSSIDTTAVDASGNLINRTGADVFAPQNSSPYYPSPDSSNVGSLVSGTDENRHFNENHVGIQEELPASVFYQSDGTYGAFQGSIDTGGSPSGIDYHDHSYDLPNHYHRLVGQVTPQGSVSLNTSSGVLSFDILSLRHAEALQIWRENALRAGNHIKDNMLAHYGVASDFNDHRPVYLGSVSAPLNIGDIAATANSSSGVNDVVGDIAGKGLSSLSEKVFKFHAKDFGVIMVMFSMLPEAEYDALGIERTNQLLEQEDFFMPEFENLGLEPVDRINFGTPAGTPPGTMVATGYAPRYYGYKTKLDKCFGQFAGNGVFRTWTSQRSDVTTFVKGVSASVPLNLLYVNPAIYDANFNVGIANSPQFLCDVYFDVDAVRPMSVVGLPFS